MDIASSFIIYVTLFRLAIIATGVISIILGYRLFCKGVFPGEGDKGATVEADIAGSKFTLKSAAPGIFFAFFGVIIISVMMAKGNPEFSLEMLNKATLKTNDGSKEEVEPETSSKILLRGDNKVELLTKKGINKEKQGNMDKAIEAYREAVNLVICPMSYLAWLYQKEGNFDEGLLLAQVSVMMNPNEADYVDTLAVILCKMGKREEALPLMKKAAELKPNKFSNRLENFQKGLCE